MPTIPSDIPRVPAFTDSARVAPTPPAASPIVTQRYGGQNRQSSVSTSAAYRQVQTELKDMLAARGLTPDQAMKLAKAGDLPITQFARSVLIAQVLMHDPPLFDEFAKTLKLLSGRSHDVPESARIFLDGMDRVLDLDTRADAERMSRVGVGNSSVSPPRVTVEPRISETLVRRDGVYLPADWARLQGKASPDMSAEQIHAMREYLSFARVSMEEFPTRFTVDLFALNALAKRGLGMDEYMSLASEIPPLRLIHVLAREETAGHPVDAVLRTFMQALAKGDDVLELLKLIETAVAPGAKNAAGGMFPFASSPARAVAPPAEGKASAQTLSSASLSPEALLSSGVPRFAPPMNHQSGVPVTIDEGDNAIMDFIALDAREGLLSAEKSAIALFPGALVLRGNALDLSVLPVGVYLAVLSALNARSEPVNLWVKLQVRERDQDKSQSPADGESAEPRENPHGQTGDWRESPPFVTVDSLREELPGLAEFLGEIVLPLDTADFSPECLVVATPKEGIIVGREEFEHGIFPHHAVIFRFLTGIAQATDPRRRFAPIIVRASALFDSFDTAIKRFLPSPSAGLENFKADAQRFFGELTSLFPAGEKSFAMAAKVLQEEAGRLATDQSGGAVYAVTATEKHGKDFVASSYARVGMALAIVGDPVGALRSFTGASLVDVSEQKYRNGLSDYLRQLRDIHFAKTTASKVNRLYEIRLAHADAVADSVSTDADWAGRFLAVTGG